MSNEDRVQAIREFGFTEHQARFLVTVMLHSGMCLLRQYTAFAGIVPGQKTRKFFHKLVSRRYATAYPCRHNRARVYHVQCKPLYRAIGQTDSRHRRPLSAARVVDGLMLLDAVLASPEVVSSAAIADAIERGTGRVECHGPLCTASVQQTGRERPRRARAKAAPHELRGSLSPRVSSLFVRTHAGPDRSPDHCPAIPAAIAPPGASMSVRCVPYGTKTILNQCNSVFAMRTFDDTGKEFLANYLGRSYAEVLPNLSERHAIFFGRASQCENPVLMRANDRAAFVQAFRTAHPPAAPGNNANVAADPIT